MKRSISLLFALMLCIGVAPVHAQETAFRLPPVKKVKLQNGMTVLLMEQREVPIISFNFRVRAGSIADAAGKEGTASLTAGLLRKGTKTRTADQLSSELDFIGGDLSATATPDGTTGAAEFVKKDIAKGMELLSDILIAPTFPEAEVAKLRAQRIDAVRAAKDEAQSVIGNYFNAYLYGKHPYARATGGDERTLAAVTRDDIVKFYDAYYAPSNVILAVVGDFNTNEMEAMVTNAFGKWNKKAKAATPLTAFAPVTGKRLLLVDKPDSTQTFFYIGNVGVARTNKDRVGIDLVNTLFGGRFTSRLNTELRINSGLTYGARSNFDQRLVPGAFAITTYTRNETTEKAIDMALDILKRLHANGITADELTSAKRYVKGQFPTRVESSDQLAAKLTELEFFNLDATEIDDLYKRVDALTLADANRIIKEYFPTDNYVLVLVGKRTDIEKVARKYAATVDIKSINDAGF